MSPIEQSKQQQQQDEEVGLPGGDNKTLVRNAQKNDSNNIRGNSNSNSQINSNGDNNKKSGRLCSLHEAILCKERIDALMECDSNLVSTRYEPTSYLTTVFRLRGRNFQMIAPLLFYLLLWDAFWWALLFVYYDDEDAYLRQKITSMKGDIVPLLTPVSFLMVFRLTRAAVRYWDARAALGKMIEVSRTLVSTSLVGCGSSSSSSNPTNTGGQNSNYEELLMEDFARWVSVFPIAVKNFLRPSERATCQRRVEIGKLLSDEEVDRLLDNNNNKSNGKKKNNNNNQFPLFQPILVLNNLRRLAFSLSYGTPGNNKEMVYRQLNEQIDALTGSWGAMERINGTPLPFVYVTHLRTFLIIYLFFLHVEAIARNGWISIVPLMLTSWGLLGIEAAAVECERPFHWNLNHLSLGRACVVVGQNVAQTMNDLDLVVPSG